MVWAAKFLWLSGLLQMTTALHLLSSSPFDREEERVKLYNCLPQPTPSSLHGLKKTSFSWTHAKYPHHTHTCEVLLSPVWFSPSVTSNSATPWITARQASLSITNSWSLPKLMSIESVMPSSHLILCRPLLLLPPIPPSIRVFSNEATLHMRWPKYWSFSFSISPSNEHPGLISFRMDWWVSLQSKGLLDS